MGGSGEIMMKEEINVAKVEVIVYSWRYISYLDLAYLKTVFFPIQAPLMSVDSSLPLL